MKTKPQMPGESAVLATSKTSLHFYKTFALKNAFQEDTVTLVEVHQHVRHFSLTLFSDKKRMIPMVALQLIRRVR